MIELENCTVTLEPWSLPTTKWIDGVDLVITTWAGLKLRTTLRDNESIEAYKLLARQQS